MPFATYRLPIPAFTIYRLPFTIDSVSFYPPKISERFAQTKNAGKLEDISAVGTEANFTCGVLLEFYLDIDGDSKTIRKAKFKTNGCGYVIAISDFLAERVVGKKLPELQGLELFEKEITKEFGEVPPARHHCVNLCFDALHKTLAEYRVQKVTEWTGEKALICTCFGVEEETIENMIRSGDIKSVEQVGESCNAGTGCGSCQFLIQEILDSR